MDFRQIEAFVAVYRYRNFSRAGKTLYLTQPTISSHINDLENELGLKLFDRSSRDVTPTKAGDIFYQYAVNLLETRDKAICLLNRYSKEIGGRLEIAASTIPSQYLLPRLIKAFSEEYPNIRFLIKQAGTMEVIAEIVGRKYQLGIVGTKLDEDKLEYEVLAQDKLVLVAAPDYPAVWTENPGLSWQDLLEQPFILREQGSGTRREFENVLREKGLDPDSLKVIAEMNSTEAIIQNVKEGLGIAVVSSLSVEEDLRIGLLKAYDLEGWQLVRNFYLVTYRNQPLSPNVAAFREFILSYFNSAKAFVKL